MPHTKHASGHATLTENLLRACSYPHPVSNIRMLETHISWVFLTGEYAYKIKKPLNLGFLDFSTLEKRRWCCEEELRLNCRLAPQIYLDVVSITGSAAAPRMAGAGQAIEYAVRMRQFPQESLASALLASGSLLPQHVESLAATLAAFHQTAPATNADSRLGTPQLILDAALQNFDQLSPLLTAVEDAALLEKLRGWTVHEHTALIHQMEQRRSDGAVRECHGDLHLGNIVRFGNSLVPFDCIEFNPQLRWIDVLSEVAFLVMDLHDRGHPRLGWLFLNAYLEHTGDYAGLTLLPFYLVYRAMVRAKVHALRANQPGLDDARRATLLRASRTYLALAAEFAHRPDPVLIITHGASGSGKSRIAGELMQQLGALRIRSDVERKRWHGLLPRERSAAGVEDGLYGKQATEATYHHLARLAQQIISAGYTAIVDAAFLKRWQRELLARIANEAGVPFLIMAITAPDAVMRQRILQRQAAGNDPSDAGITVLEHQLQTQEALTAAERTAAIELSSDGPDPAACSRQVIDALAALQQR